VHKKHTDEQAAQASLAKDEYLVAIKILLRDGDKLLVTKDSYGAWDIPGGRIRKDQFDVSDEDILAEKVRVEIGPQVRYELGDIKTTLRVQREEIGRNGAIVRVYAICYEATYLAGEIELGGYHENVEWIDLRTANLADYTTPDGWVHQLTEYQESVKRGK